MPRPVSVANDPECRGCSRQLCRCWCPGDRACVFPRWARHRRASEPVPQARGAPRHSLCYRLHRPHRRGGSYARLRGSGGRVGIVRERHPTPPALAAVLAAGSCPIPDYVPPLVRPALRWARQHVARVSARYGVGIEDLWNEAIAALLRVSIHRAENAHEIRGCDHYCRTAVHRACWRYVVRDHVRRQRHGTRVALEDVAQSAELTAPSAEAEAIARDAARRAWILREHAALAVARGDPATATRLRNAAAEAAAVARTSRRRSAVRL